MMAEKHPDLPSIHVRPAIYGLMAMAFSSLTPFLEEVWNTSMFPSQLLRWASRKFSMTMSASQRFETFASLRFDMATTATMFHVYKLKVKTAWRLLPTPRQGNNLRHMALKLVPTSLVATAVTSGQTETTGIGQTFAVNNWCYSSMIYPSHWGTAFGIELPGLTYELVDEYMFSEEQVLKTLE